MEVREKKRARPKWQVILKDIILAVLMLLGTYLFMVGFTYTTGTIPELFGARGEGLHWWSVGLRVVVALVFLFLGYWVIFHPIQTRRHLLSFLKWMQARIRPPKPIVAPDPEEEVPPAPLKRVVSRRRFMAETGALAAFTSYAFFAEPNNPLLNRIEIKIPGLPPAFNRMTLAQITDIHIDPYATPEDVASFVAQVNALKPDLTVITGDFISRGTYYFDMAAETLGKLRDGAKLGVYGVSGNHDHWSDGDDLGRIEPLFARQGIPLLRNTATEIKLNGDSLWLLGTDDSSTHNEDLGKTLRALGLQSVEAASRDQRPKILFSHNPNFAEHVRPTNINLMLSGHTHGGQIYVPGAMEVAMLAVYPRFRGYYRLDNLQLYVNSGYGTVGPPFRFLARPEITLFTLVSA